MLYLKIVKLNPDLQIKDTDMLKMRFINITYGEQERELLLNGIMINLNGVKHLYFL